MQSKETENKPVSSEIICKWCGKPSYPCETVKEFHDCKIRKNE